MVTHFTAGSTYSGLMEGHPSARINEMILDNALQNAGQVWGGRKVHLAPPQVNSAHPDHPRLPGVIWTAWCKNLEPVCRGADGSELVVVWLANEQSELPLKEILHAGLHAVDWTALAKDFDW
jgi:hypothetical protein